MKTKEEINQKTAELFARVHEIQKERDLLKTRSPKWDKLLEEHASINDKVEALMWVTKTIENL